MTTLCIVRVSKDGSISVLLAPNRSQGPRWRLRGVAIRSEVWTFDTHVGALRAAEMNGGNVRRVSDIF